MSNHILPQVFGFVGLFICLFGTGIFISGFIVPSKSIMPLLVKLVN